MDVAVGEARIAAEEVEVGEISERGGGLNNESYAPGVNAFNALLTQWRDRGDLAGLELG